MKVALVGYGYWGKIWEKILNGFGSKATLSCVYSPSLSDSGIYTSQSDEVLSDSEIQAVVIAAPNLAHFDWVKKSLEAGKHVLCEKPLVLSGEQAVVLKSLADEKGLVLETNFTYLHSPTVGEMKANLDSIGEVQAMESYIDGFGAFYEKEDVFSVHFPHVVALSYYFFPTEDFEVFRENLVIGSSGYSEVGVIKMESPNIRIWHHSSLLGIKRERKIVIFGSKGTLEYDATSDAQFKMRLFSSKDRKYEIIKDVEKSFDESSNIQKSFEEFMGLIETGASSNIDLSIKVSAAMERVSGGKS